MHIADDTLALEVNTTSLVTALEQLLSLEQFHETLVKNKGMNATLALEAEQLVPGFLDNTPIGFYTQQTTKTQYRASLESLSDQQDSLFEKIKKIIEAIIAKFKDWVQRARDHFNSEAQEKLRATQKQIANNREAIVRLLKMTRLSDDKIKAAFAKANRIDSSSYLSEKLSAAKFERDVTKLEVRVLEQYDALFHGFENSVIKHITGSQWLHAVYSNPTLLAVDGVLWKAWKLFEDYVHRVDTDGKLQHEYLNAVKSVLGMSAVDYRNHLRDELTKGTTKPVVFKDFFPEIVEFVASVTNAEYSCRLGLMDSAITYVTPALRNLTQKIFSEKKDEKLTSSEYHSATGLVTILTRSIDELVSIASLVDQRSNVVRYFIETIRKRFTDYLRIFDYPEGDIPKEFMAVIKEELHFQEFSDMYYKLYR